MMRSVSQLFRPTITTTLFNTVVSTKQNYLIYEVKEGYNDLIDDRLKEKLGRVFIDAEVKLPAMCHSR